MDEIARALILVGALFFAGLAADRVARRLRIPRVTMLMVMGVGIGPAGLGWLEDPDGTWLSRVAPIALALVGFLLGSSFERRRLRRHGATVLALCAGVVCLTAALVVGGLALLGVPWPVALALGGIAAATDPAACQDVVRESRARGPFAQTLLGVVAVDDALGLLLFALLLGLAQGAADAGEAGGLLLTALRDVGGAVVLGAALGVPMAYLTGRVSPGDPTLAEALGGVLLCSGLALWLEVSFLIACMTLGAVVANFARHHVRPFHAVENVEWPFVTLFFLLAGASLRIDALWALGALVPAYVALRVLGRLVGALAGGAPVGWPARRRLWMGAALLPQAGVAVGMALVAGEALPELGAAVVPVTIASTVLFELVGPVFTRLALGGVGEIRSPKRRG